MTTPPASPDLGPLLLARLTELHAKATPGPWRLDRDSSLSVVTDDATVAYCPPTFDNGEAARNAAYILAAHEDLPALLAAIAALTRKVAELEAAREADTKLFASIEWNARKPWPRDNSVNPACPSCHAADGGSGLYLHAPGCKLAARLRDSRAGGGEAGVT